MAGWGDDPTLAELRGLLYEQGWKPVEVTEATVGMDGPSGARPPGAAGGVGGRDTVVVEGPDGERKTFSSDHIAFHRFVEGLHEDFDV
jgi:hypothetical protein